MTDLLAFSIQAAYIGLLLSIFMTGVRLVIGPTLADRVVSLDLLAFLVIAYIAVHSIDTGVKSYLDIAITLGLVAFLGTIAFGRYIIRVEEDRRRKRALEKGQELP